MRHPRFLHKYRSLDTASDLAHVGQIFLKNELWLAGIDSLDDPFDGALYFEDSVAEKMLADSLSRVVHNHSGLTPEEVASEVAAIMGEPGFSLNDIFDAISRQVLGSFGVCSFCASVRNPAVWAGYANSHQGICIRFDVANDLATFRCREVAYGDYHPPAYVAGRVKFNDVYTPLAQKSSEWAGQREWRRVEADAAGTPLPFRPEALTAVVFGLRCSDAHQTYIVDLVERRAALGYPRPQLYTVQKGREAPKLQIQRKRI